MNAGCCTNAACTSAYYYPIDGPEAGAWQMLHCFFLLVWTQAIPVVATQEAFAVFTNIKRSREGEKEKVMAKAKAKAKKVIER